MSLFSKPKVQAPPPPPPRIDEALNAVRNAQQNPRIRGRKASILTSDTGLPDLGTVSAPAA